MANRKIQSRRDRRKCKMNFRRVPKAKRTVVGHGSAINSTTVYIAKHKKKKRIKPDKRYVVTESEQFGPMFGLLGLPL